MLDFERFIRHSDPVRYLDLDSVYFPTIPTRFFDDYCTLFPTRPCFPHLRSLICSLNPPMSLNLLHKGLISLQIDRSALFSTPSSDEQQITANNLLARLPNLVHLRDIVPMPNRGRFSGAYAPAGTPFQRDTDRILHNWTFLRHLEASRHLPDFPAFFAAISQLCRLEYLKIAIAREDKFEKGVAAGVGPALGASHTASELEIEGEIDDLHVALRLCSPGVVLTSVSLLFYMNGGSDQESVAREYFTLPPLLSHIPITTLTIDLLDNGEDNQNGVPPWSLSCSAFSTFASPKCNFSKLELRIPFSVAIAKDFLDLLSRSSPFLESFVILRCTSQDEDYFYFPTLTLENMIQFALTLPRLQYLGLEMDARANTEPEANLGGTTSINPLIGSSSSRLTTIEVGSSPIDDAAVVAKLLQQHFPALKTLGWDNDDWYDPEDDYYISYRRLTREYDLRWREVSVLLGCSTIGT